MNEYPDVSEQLRARLFDSLRADLPASVTDEELRALVADLEQSARERGKALRKAREAE